MAENLKKVELITGISSDPDTKLTVQKSLPLLALWQSDLTLAEFKILDAYLARIDSKKPEKRSVRFEKGELEQILGVKKINVKELKKRLKRLGTMVQVDDPTQNRSFRISALFERAVCEQDEYELWQVDLKCTEDAMKYIFNIENLGYLRYKLRSIVSITSRYSYILFIYLEQNRFRKTWEIDVNSLKKILKCNDDGFYSEFRYFNQRILKNCQKELHEKTECRFTYEPVKRGRTVASVRFTVETLPEVEPENRPEGISMESGDDVASWLSGACSPVGKDCEFTKMEMEEIAALVLVVPGNKLPQDTTTWTDNYQFRIYHYLSICYAKMNREAEKKTIKNRFAYLCKIIQRDAGID